MVGAEVNKKPLETAESAITFLSSFSDEVTKRYGLQNRVVVVFEARKAIFKHRMMETVRAKIEVTEHKVREVVKLFRPLTTKGIPFFWAEMGPLMSQKDYKECLVHCRLDHNKFEDMQQALSGKVIFDKLANDFQLWFDFKSHMIQGPQGLVP